MSLVSLSNLPVTRPRLVDTNVKQQAAVGAQPAKPATSNPSRADPAGISPDKQSMQAVVDL